MIPLAKMRTHLFPVHIADYLRTRLILKGARGPRWDVIGVCTVKAMNIWVV
jgi:hypothetical protein